MVQEQICQVSIELEHEIKYDYQQEKSIKVVNCELARDCLRREGSESAAISPSHKPNLGNSRAMMFQLGLLSIMKYHKRSSGKNRPQIERQSLKADCALYGIV